jgi:hypothetical protein
MRSVTKLPLYVQTLLAFMAIWLAVTAAAALTSPSALQPLGLFGVMVAVPWAIWCAIGLLVQWLVGLTGKPRSVAATRRVDLDA